MTAPVRFPYAGTGAAGVSASLLAYVPLTLRHESRSMLVSGLLDSGSTVNVLPYPIGLQLGFVWDQQSTPVHLTGSLAKLPARGVIVSGEVESFSTVELAFAWTQSEDVPVILGQVNLFMEFEVCFFGADSTFEIKQKST